MAKVKKKRIKLKKSKIEKIKPLQNKKIIKAGPRPTIDLRSGEVKPVKQHGFKEGEITNTNFLFN